MEKDGKGGEDGGVDGEGDREPGKSCDAPKVLLDLLTHLVKAVSAPISSASAATVSAIFNKSSIINISNSSSVKVTVSISISIILISIISTDRLSNGAKLFCNRLKLSPSLGWTIRHLRFILQCNLRLPISYMLFHILILARGFVRKFDFPLSRSISTVLKDIMGMTTYLKIPHTSRVLGSRRPKFRV